MRGRFVYDSTLWAYGFKHNDLQALKESVSFSHIVNNVGPVFTSELYSRDNEKYIFNQYQHLEYSPLINARAHTLKASGGMSSSVGLKAAPIQVCCVLGLSVVCVW